MSFAENLKSLRKAKNITQEQLAELLNVSRQAVSKWESGNGYPETEKLLILSKELGVSLDSLLDNNVEVENKVAEEKKERTDKTEVVNFPTGKIAISTFDNKDVFVCQSVKSSQILFAAKDEPKYVLHGVDNVTFWGEHMTTALGWYATQEEIQKEIKEIVNAMSRGEPAYTLKYAADVEFVGFFGQPKIKKKVD